MSILNREIIDRPSAEKEAARRLLMMTKQTFTQMVNSFNEGARIFWENGRGATPQQIAAELGTDAVEVFQLHYKLGQLIGEVNPAAVVDGFNKVGNFTMNENGTVTILENEEEENPTEE
jgi:hypothetical protein